MTESRSGVWWIDDRDEHVAGTLVRVDGRWELSTIGALPLGFQWSTGLSLVPPTTIYGCCHGTRYTLHDAYLIDSRGPTHHFTVPYDERDRANDQSSQRWSAYMLLQGDALPAETLYSAATFEIAGMSSLWTYSGLEPGAEVTSRNYDPPEPGRVDCDNGLSLTIETGAIALDGVRNRAITEHVRITAESQTGFTLSDLVDQIVRPLRSLVAIAVHNRVDYYNLRLQPRDNKRPMGRGYFIEVDPDTYDASIEPKHGYFPAFTFKNVDISIVSRWLHIAANNPVPLAVAAPRLESGSVQSQVVEVVNAAETLHRSLYEEVSSPFANRVTKTLKETGYTEAERFRVRKAVKMTEVTLERRLTELADGLGNNFCRWLLQALVGDWAKVAAHVRNALSHGYPTSHRVQHDHSALLGVLRVTQAVIALRLLVEAGLPTDFALVEILRHDPQYRALMEQSLANWDELAGQLSGA